MLPQFVIGISVFHTDGLHHPSASWIVYIVCGRDIGYFDMFFTWV